MSAIEDLIVHHDDLCSASCKWSEAVRAEIKDGRWIYCEDGVPKETGGYIVSCFNDRTGKNETFTYHHFDPLEWQWSKELHPYAWQPLPEPARAIK